MTFFFTISQTRVCAH